jgi:DNA-binding NtrC family response regulator
MLRVWVVDDDALVALYLGELLQDQGFAVTTFGDPRRALATFEADPEALDVLVTDQRMPALSGEALAAALLRRRPRLRVILCSAWCRPEDERRAQRLGIHHVFRKPFDARVLLQAIRGDGDGAH